MSGNPRWTLRGSDGWSRKRRTMGNKQGRAAGAEKGQKYKEDGNGLGKSGSKGKVSTKDAAGGSAKKGVLGTGADMNNSLTVDDFELLKVVGKGSFGKVMQVKKKDDGKVYAMKILKKQAILSRNQVCHLELSGLG